MELYFLCPEKQVGFWSADWTTDHGLQVHVEENGSKRLQGTVRVQCPLCRAEHAYAPDELACPLTIAGSGGRRSQKTKGGT